MSWKDLKVDGLGRIDRVAAEFDVWTGNKLPFARFRVKVLESPSGSFHASINVAIKNPATGHPEFIGGIGSTVEEALEDGLKHFLQEVAQHRAGRELGEDDFHWSDASDF